MKARHVVPAIVLLLTTVLLAAMPNTARLLADEKAVTLYLADHALSPELPNGTVGSFAPMINETAGVTQANLCRPPAVNTTAPGSTPSPGTAVTTRTVSQAVDTITAVKTTVTVSAGVTAPTWPTEPSTTVSASPPVASQNCPLEWGGWTAPGSFTIVQPSPTTKYAEGVLHLWITSSQNISLLGFTARLCKADCSKSLFDWTFDAKGTTSLATSEIAVVQNLHTDPSTGRPALLVRAGESVPLTLAQNADQNQVNGGERLRLVFDNVQTVSTNGTAPGAGPLPPSPLGGVLIEFGNRSRPSSISFFVTASSAYSDSGVLGLFLDEEEKMAYKVPQATTAKRRPLQLSPQPTAPTPLLLGQATADRDYVLRGNALVKIFYLINVTNPTLNQVNANPRTLLLDLRFELNLTIGDQTVKSNTGSLRIGIEIPRPAANNAPNNQPKPRDLTFGLPTSGLVVPGGTPIRFSVAVEGFTNSSLNELQILYGSRDQPTGLRLTTVPDVVAARTGLGVRASPPAEPAEGAGAANGTYSLWIDHASARIHPGQDHYFEVSVRNTGNWSVPFELFSTAPRGQRAVFDPQRGVVGPASTNLSYLQVGVAAAAPPGPLQFSITAKFNRTVTVGTLSLVVVVDQPAEAAANALASAPGLPSDAGDETTSPEPRGAPKALSGAKQPGFELFVLGLALVSAAFWTRRRR